MFTLQAINLNIFLWIYLLLPQTTAAFYAILINWTRDIFFYTLKYTIKYINEYIRNTFYAILIDFSFLTICLATLETIFRFAYQSVPAALSAFVSVANVSFEHKCQILLFKGQRLNISLPPSFTLTFNTTCCLCICILFHLFLHFSSSSSVFFASGQKSSSESFGLGQLISRGFRFGVAKLTTAFSNLSGNKK